MSILYNSSWVYHFIFSHVENLKCDFFFFPPLPILWAGLSGFDVLHKEGVSQIMLSNKTLKAKQLKLWYLGGNKNFKIQLTIFLQWRRLCKNKWGTLPRRGPARMSTSRCRALLLSHTCKVMCGVNSVAHRSRLTFYYFNRDRRCLTLSQDRRGRRIPGWCWRRTKTLQPLCTNLCLGQAQVKHSLIIKETVKGEEILPNSCITPAGSVYVWWFFFECTVNTFCVFAVTLK